MKRFLLLTPLILALFGCNLLPVEEEPMAAPALKTYETAQYATFQVARGDLERYVTVGVSYIPTYSETLSFAESGILYDEIFVAVGDSVSAGDVLAALDHKELDLSIEELEFRLLQEKSNRQSVEETYTLKHGAAKLSSERKSLTLAYNQRMNELNGEIENLELRLSHLREQLSRRILVAGMNGVVAHVRRVKEGEASLRGESVVTVTDKTNSVFSYTGDSWEAFTPGVEVTITSSKEEYPARVVSASELGITGKERTIYFALTELAPMLKERASGTVSLLLEERMDILYIPTSAIQKVRDETFVYLFEDGIRATRTVVTGMETKDFVEITEGLAAGEAVITGGIR